MLILKNELDQKLELYKNNCINQSDINQYKENYSRIVLAKKLDDSPRKSIKKQGVNNDLKDVISPLEESLKKAND